MKILYFAWLKAMIGTSEEDLTPPLGVNTVLELRNWLRTLSEGHSRALADLSVLRVAVDMEHVPMESSLATAREVAFFPPVTGG